MFGTNGKKVYEKPKADVMTFGQEDILKTSLLQSEDDMTSGGDDKTWGGI